MNRARAFESYWAEFERPGRPSAESLPPGPELAGVVATATALRRSAEAIPAVDLDALWQSLADRLDTVIAPAGIPLVPKAGESQPGTPNTNVIVLRPRLRWTIRVAAAAVAAAVALAMVSLQARPGSALYPVRLTVERAAVALSPRDGSIHLRVAEARLDDLVVSLRMGPVRAAPGLARSLVVNRVAAGRGGADLSDLDRRVALEVPPALSGTPSSIAASVRTILGDLLPAEEPPPNRGAAPGPGPGEGVPGNKHDPSRGHEGSGGDGENEGRDGGGKHEGHDEGGDDGSDSHGGSDSHEGSGDQEDQSGSHEESDSEGPGGGPGGSVDHEGSSEN